MPVCAAWALLQATLITVLRGLQGYFLGAFERGELAVKGAPGAAAAGDDPAAVFSAWLRRQYSAFVAALLGLLASPAVDARTQVGPPGGRLHPFLPR